MEKSKKLIAGLCTAALTLSMGTALLANNSTTSAASTDTGQTTTQQPSQRRVLTDAEKTAMEAERTARQAAAAAREKTWTALTDSQKQEVYSLLDQRQAAETSIIDKYLELGLISSTEATEMKAKLTEASTQLRSSGKMPGCGMMGGFGLGGEGGKGNGHGRPDGKDSTADSADSSNGTQTAASAI